LPAAEDFPVMDRYDNPLFLFQEGPDRPPLTLEQLAPPRTADLLTPLAPLDGFDNLPKGPPSEGKTAEPVAPPAEFTDEQKRLFALALKVAPAVVAIRVWDEFGSMISSGVGSFVSDGGLILTDSAVVHPEIAERVDYITTTAADGTNHRITGFYIADLTSGVTLLQSEDKSASHLSIKPGSAFDKETSVHVLAVSEKRGLVLADAKIVRDSSLASQGWFNIKGEDSPGAVGSPVLNGAAEIVGIVGMQVPLKHWMNFALAPDYAAYEIQRRRPALKPLSQLPRHPRIGDVAADPHFMDAFNTLAGKRIESAVSKLLKLTVKYPRSAECWALLGLGAARLGATSEAVSCQRKAVALDPKTGLYWHQLAMAKLRQENPSARDEAEDREALELAIDQRPGDKIAWLLLASRYLKANDLDKADNALRQITKLEPDYAHGFYLLAYVRGRERDFTGAEAAISRCLELDSSHADAWYYKGLLLSRADKHAQAADAFRSATLRQPNHPQAWLNLAHAYLKLRRDTEARLAFRRHQAVTASREVSSKKSPGGP
jgi:cytochrome c-type biogenesis protein CcmH/NrfG